MKKIVLTASSDLCSDQRMQRISLALESNDFEVELVGRYLGQAFDASYKSKQIKCFFNSGFLFYAEYNIRLLFYLMSNKFDCLCSVDLDTMLAGATVRKLKNIKWVFDAHEYYEETPELNQRRMLKKFWEWIGRTTVPGVDMAYTVSASLQNVFQKKYERTFKLIRNLPIHSIDSGYNAGSSLLLYQGVLNKGRGLEALILCMKELNGYKLALAGSGDIEKQLKNLVEVNNLSSQVEFYGTVLPSKLKTLTSKAVLGFNLLEGDSLNYYYSLANKYFDYMMAGVPCVTMDFPEYRTLNGQFETSVLVEDLEPRKLSKRIKELLENRSFLQKLSDNSIQAAQMLNWENESNSLVSFYKELLTP